MLVGAIPPFATHLAPLLACVTRTRGPVLELGSGSFSTPVLHAVCAGRRRLVTADNDAAWLERFRYMESAEHEFFLVENWEAFDALDQPWDVALVDQSPGHTRVEVIGRLRKRARYLVVHDTEAVAHYGFEPLLSSFRFRVDAMEYGVGIRTTVVSDLARIPFTPPRVTDNQRAITLVHRPVTVPVPDDGWHERELGALGGLPDHLLMRLDAEPGDLTAQVLFRGPGDTEDFFWGTIRGDRASLPIPADALTAVGDISWDRVTRVTVRARGGPGQLVVRGLELFVREERATA